ncbi:hypothetical protein [[Clostridium] polysaccharolyticum]|uniref:Transposase DDE domain-containing protein n=1 Tax=[Clostridium] polysaccharolyticum TaxID=29364 RepID=A0A1H9ZU03_9FIRM|nr:hypothetical protein [[Clostridium] polysaccharolyticum]SES84823.1 hypothetical protein SAMN04487772_104105 [[Clostridium] polysaccharolyticum]
MTYDMLVAGSCLLTDIFDQLHEHSKKINSVERLTRHLNKGIHKNALKSYLSLVRTMVPKNPIIHIDDSDVIKPDGYKFEALGLVRDGSKSTHFKKDIYLVLVYGITEHPMMLATNKEIKSKEDVLAVAKHYFSRWKIEEYFRCKKQMFQFENFRVRKLKAINAINFYITLCMAFLAHISMKPDTNALKVAIIRKTDPIKEKVHFCYYRLAKGISSILIFAKEGIRLCFRTKRPAYRQLCLKLTV